jgi:hypothetical protein
MKMDHQLASFIDDLKATHRENLVAVILYGQAAAAAAPAVTGQDLLIALERLTPADLRNAHAAIREWQRLGHPVPVFFTVSELENSADVFPIEFRQMVRAHKVLYGRDVLAGVDVSDRNLRHQVEYELRSRLLLLRRQYVPASVSAEGLMTLMADSIVSFAAPLQGLLMLKGLEPPAEKHAAVALAVEHLGLDGATFERIINIHQNNLQESLSETEANQLFGEYLRQIERIIDAVDSIEEV